MNWLANLWNAISPYVAGISIGSVVTAIVCGILKGAFEKKLSKINVENIVETATNKAVDKIRKVTFKQTIQPIVESELRKVNEAANERIEDCLATTNAKLDALLLIEEKQAAYFDNSYFVGEDKKAELHDAINSAKNVTSVETVADEQEVKVFEDLSIPAVESAKTPKSTLLR